MRCLKCGRESEETFCRICQEEMEKYPVKPGTIVLLPKERTEEKKPAPRKPQVPPETVIRGQRRTIRRLSGGIAALGGDNEELTRLRRQYRNLDITSWDSENRLQMK